MRMVVKRSGNLFSSLVWKRIIRVGNEMNFLFIVTTMQKILRVCLEYK